MRTFFVGPFIFVAILASAPSSSAGSSYIGTAWAFPIVKSTLKYDVDDLDEKGKTKALLPDIVFIIHDASTWSAELDGGDSISGTYTVKMSDSKVEVVALEFDAASVEVMKQRYEDDLEDLFGIPVSVKKLTFGSAKVTFKKKGGSVVATVRLKPKLAGNVKVGGKVFPADAKGKISGKSEPQAK